MLTNIPSARQTLMPSLSELCVLFDVVPELPPPKPREKVSQSSQANSKAQRIPIHSKGNGRSEPWAGSVLSVIRSCLGRTFSFWGVNRSEDVKSASSAASRPNAFQMLKLGKKMIVIAAVDCGVISFYRFGQGGFEDWPML